jgi:anthranilate 1,2-dioxygenase small subunit
VPYLFDRALRSCAGYSAYTGGRPALVVHEGRLKVTDSLRGVTDGPELQYRVENLLARYVLAIDEDRLEAWPELFVDDCVYKLWAKENADRGLPVAAIFCDSKGMLIDRVVSLRNANIYEKHGYRHIVSSVLIDAISGDCIEVRSNYVVYRTRTNGRTELYNAGIYRDKIVSIGGDLFFKEKIAVFDTNIIDALLATPI